MSIVAAAKELELILYLAKTGNTLHTIEEYNILLRGLL